MNEQEVRAWIRAHGGTGAAAADAMDYTTGREHQHKGQAWAAGERYQGRLGMLAKEARSRYGQTLAGQTYYDAAICARLGRALDSGDLIAEAEVRAYAFAFGSVPSRTSEEY